MANRNNNNNNNSEEDMFVEQKKKRKPRKQAEAWSTALTIKLVSAVEPHACLWNHLIDAYKDRERRESAWQDIADAIGRSVEECKLRWSSVRVNFKVSNNKLLVCVFTNCALLLI